MPGGLTPRTKSKTNELPDRSDPSNRNLVVSLPVSSFKKQGFANFWPGTSSRRDSLDIGYRYFILALLFLKHAYADGPLWRRVLVPAKVTAE